MKTWSLSEVSSSKFLCEDQTKTKTKPDLQICSVDFSSQCFSVGGKRLHCGLFYLKVICQELPASLDELKPQHVAPSYLAWQPEPVLLGNQSTTYSITSWERTKLSPSRGIAALWHHLCHAVHLLTKRQPIYKQNLFFFLKKKKQYFLPFVQEMLSQPGLPSKAPLLCIPSLVLCNLKHAFSWIPQAAIWAPQSWAVY